MVTKDLARFLRFVDRSGGCWVWAGNSNTDLATLVPGLAEPWHWIQPRTDAELIERLAHARDYNVYPRCSVAHDRLVAIGERGK